MLVMNDGGMKHLLEDKFTVGADATAAAGPVGREATAQTDAALHAELLSYSRSQGIFAGLTLEGATLASRQRIGSRSLRSGLNNREILTGEVKTPAVAEKLEHTAQSRI